MGSNIILQEVGYFESSAVSSSLRSQVAYLFQVAVYIPSLEMTMVTVVHLCVKLPFTFLLLQLTGNW